MGDDEFSREARICVVLNEIAPYKISFPLIAAVGLLVVET
jgi:hypothetical protein